MELISPLLLYRAAIDMQKINFFVHSAQEKHSLESLLTGEDCAAILPMMVSLESELRRLNWQLYT
jgi:hypothetical protein